MSISVIIGFFTTKLGRYVGVALGLVVLVGAFSAREQRKGADKVVAKIEANNNAVSKKADSAARKSADPRAAGVLNPNYRAD